MHTQIEQHYTANTDRLRIREEAANGAWLAVVRGKLSKYAYRVLGNWEDAEDAVQDCYERVLKYQDSFKGSDKDFDGWVFIILANVINNIRAGRTNEPETVEADDTISTDEYLVPYDTPEDSVAIIKWNSSFDALCLKMSQRDVGILQLYFLYGHTMPDVAQILDVNIHTVHRVIHTNRKLIVGGNNGQ